ncbi:MAG: LptF/LptG family permease [Victivallaceae bacterium]|nr:LptF/LptG family permease [Victivallaceae bacterium]
MKILNWYILRGFLVAFFMAIAILTFGLTGANLIKVMDYLSRGISLWTFCKFTVYILPNILTFTVPWAVMVAVMLVFGRMSADNEITAMRACGVSILQIISPIVLVTLLLTGLCLYLQVEVGPPLLKKSRSMMENAVMDQPLAIFEPGKPVTYDQKLIYIDNKESNGNIYGVQLYTLNDKGDEVEQDISAESGKLSADPVARILTIKLFNAIATSKTGDLGEGSESDAIDRIFTGDLEIPINYGNKINAENVNVAPKYMRLQDLMGYIHMVKQTKMPTTELEVELNQRIAFALAPIAFLLLGMPLAIRTNRRETSIGLFISVILAGIFFLSIILCESFSNYPQLYPQYLLWLPNIIFQLLGAHMIMRISRR